MAEETTPEETPPDETPAAEEAVEAPEAAETEASTEAPESAPDTPAEPEVVKTPKERRAERRAAVVAKRGPRRASSPEERAAERKRKAAQRTRYRAKQKEKRAAEPKAGETPPEWIKPEGTGHQKVRQGIVVSDKADKTITVRIDVARRHRRYNKTIRSSSTLHAHDETNDARTGDTVRIVEARPLSRTKRWRLVEVLERAK